MTAFKLALGRAARAWLDARTPFLAHGASRQHGVDCVHLAHALYEEAGLPLPPIPRAYFLDESRHSPTDKLIGWIENTGKFEPVVLESDFPVGTLLCADIGLSPYHVAVVYETNQAIHCLRHEGVCAVSVGDPLFERFLRAYRPQC